ncbi:FtsW/RodA/SpoVE family cell cycle protein [Vagococcus bubulae]|uniref:Rod shape-determining protein RodA n=1 Tax=Vagococcus bubulae TaxID=1977868 RepID=A0A429ZBZ0_9ENTE|nr:FtsW/RodA/SpoVE family cell cycle protein [Vagococcus bubulae]RST91165.1 rod shape-determining protein RodA [Vagococcus bubulae]
MLRAEKRELHQVDYRILLPVFLLSIIGLMSMYVAISGEYSSADAIKKMMQQVLWYAIGAASLYVTMVVKPNIIWKLTPYAYGVGILLMVALLFFYDAALAIETGSKNWFRFGSLTFQPAELVKVLYILMLAYIVTKHNQEFGNRDMKTDSLLIGKMLLVTLPIAILLNLQNDFGTMLVFLAILGGVFLVSGISWKIVLSVVGVFLFLGITLIFLVTTENGRQFLYKLGFKSYQFARIDAWIDPFFDPTGQSYQQVQALLAIATGGFFGKGYNVSDVHVPVRSSDMIFSVIAENFGFVGSVFVILLYLLLIYRMIHACFETKNVFFSYVTAGVVMLILFHVFENIGANIGLLPLTGIPLPFISQGGSALVSNMIGVGLVMNMRYHYSSKKNKLV